MYNEIKEEKSCGMIYTVKLPSRVPEETVREKAAALLIMEPIARRFD
jgi:hypothetical protein